MIVFGPVPSRRLGKSLGINNIPAKNCSYNCVYCQVGKTLAMKSEREAFYEADKIINECKKRLEEIKAKGNMIDYLTFVADGESSLDINLGKEIQELKSLGVKVAVITNASLIIKKDVCEDLACADWVSLKVDAINDNIWHRINRPLKRLDHLEILNSMIAFAAKYTGQLVTETMLVKGINDKEEEFKAIASFLIKLKPKKAYISVPTRPPANNIIPAKEFKVNAAYQIFSGKGIKTELMIGYEGNDFFSTGSIEKDLLSITAVHPVKKEAVELLLSQAGAEWVSVDRLIKEGKIIKIDYQGETFYMANIVCRN